MPKPSDLHVNKPLISVNVNWLQDQNEFVTPSAFPFVPVDKESDIYWEWNQSDQLRDVAQERAAGTEAPGVDWDVDQKTYTCKEYALKHKIPDRVRAADDSLLMQDSNISLMLTHQNLIKLDRLFAAAYFKASTWIGSSTGADIVPGVKWDNSAGVPVEDVDKEKAAMRKKCGKRGNVFIVSEDTHRALRNNPDVVGRLSNAAEKVLTHADMARIFEVEKYIVADSTYETAAKNATSSMDFIFGANSALLLYVAPTPAREIPSAGYVFVDKVFGGNNWGLRIKKFRWEILESDIIEQAFMLDMKLVSSLCGTYFATVLT